MIGCCEGEVHYCCLKSYGVFYFSNVWWDHIPDANCTGVKGEHCSVDAAPVGDVMVDNRCHQSVRPSAQRTKNWHSCKDL